MQGGGRGWYNCRLHHCTIDWGHATEVPLPLGAYLAHFLACNWGGLLCLAQNLPNINNNSSTSHFSRTDKDPILNPLWHMDDCYPSTRAGNFSCYGGCGTLRDETSSGPNKQPGVWLLSCFILHVTFLRPICNSPLFGGRFSFTGTAFRLKSILQI